MFVLPNFKFGSGEYEHFECETCCRIANPAGRGAGGGKLRLRRSFPPPSFSQTAVISNGAKRNENPEGLAEGNSLMRQFELHPAFFKILHFQNIQLLLPHHLTH